MQDYPTSENFPVVSYLRSFLVSHHPITHPKLNNAIEENRFRPRAQFKDAETQTDIGK